jgi:hypothetical protein
MLSRCRAMLGPIFALLLTMIAAPSEAAPPTSQGKISGFTIVDGWFYFWLENGGTGPLCSSASGGSTHVGIVTADTVADADSRRSMLNLVMTALKAGRNVRVYANNNTAWGCRVTALGMD